MKRMVDSDREKVVNLFELKHWSCNMISKEIGFSRAGIKKFLNHSGYNTSKAAARNMNVECLNCGRVVRVTTSIGRKKKFCSTNCYYEYIRDGEYKPWRQGQRVARAILRTYVSRYFGKGKAFVSHHKDGDDINNSLNNLMAFNNQSDHLAYHRKHRIVSVLIDGSTFV